MSNTPGITPLTTDIEDIRHSDDEAEREIEHGSDEDALEDEDAPETDGAGETDEGDLGD